MKENIHPDNQVVAVECRCGHRFNISSTLKKKVLRIEVCSQCHSFFTGEKKVIDIAGQFARFQKRYGNLQEKN